MATYKIGDPYEFTYPDAPRAERKQFVTGQQISIRDKQNMLIAMWEVIESDENGARGKITYVFQVKAPQEPRRVKPAQNRKKHPI